MKNVETDLEKLEGRVESVAHGLRDRVESAPKMVRGPKGRLYRQFADGSLERSHYSTRYIRETDDKGRSTFRQVVSVPGETFEDRRGTEYALDEKATLRRVNPKDRVGSARQRRRARKADRRRERGVRFVAVNGDHMPQEL